MCKIYVARVRGAFGPEAAEPHKASGGAGSEPWVQVYIIL